MIMDLMEGLEESEGLILANNSSNNSYSNDSSVLLREATAEEGNDDDDKEGSMGLAMDVAWTLVYSVMIIVAIAGNAIVMWIVTGERNLFDLPGNCFGLE